MKARQLLLEGMAVAELTHDDLKALPGSEPRKVAIARVVSERTTVKMAWIAEHLELRSAANASHLIRRHRKHPPALAKALQRWIVAMPS